MENASDAIVNEKGWKICLPGAKGKTSGKRRGSENWLPPAWPTWCQFLISNSADAVTQTPIRISAPFFPVNSNPITSSPINEVLPNLFNGPFPLFWILSAWRYSAPKLHLNILVRRVTLSFPTAWNGFASLSFPKTTQAFVWRGFNFKPLLKGLLCSKTCVKQGSRCYNGIGWLRSAKGWRRVPLPSPYFPRSVCISLAGSQAGLLEP